MSKDTAIIVCVFAGLGMVISFQHDWNVAAGVCFVVLTAVVAAKVPINEDWRQRIKPRKGKDEE